VAGEFVEFTLSSCDVVVEGLLLLARFVLASSI
jgi:hypothetical protein